MRRPETLTVVDDPVCGGVVRCVVSSSVGKKIDYLYLQLFAALELGLRNFGFRLLAHGPTERCEF